MIWTKLAAGLMFLTLLIHVFLGGRDAHEPIQAALEAPPLAAISAVIWHGVTVVLAVLAAGLWVLSMRRDLALEALLAAIQLGFAGLFIFYSVTRLGTVWAMPQWVIFLMIPALTRFGQRRTPLG